MKDLKKQIEELLKGSPNQSSVEKFASYCQRLLMERTKEGKPKNPFIQSKSPEELASLYNRVASEGLDFDGKNITLQSTGISYNYVAYKNKMILVYPESLIQMDVVKEGDVFSFANENGKIEYKHVITNAFETANKETIIGAYCVIKNQRGDFLTLLSKEEIEKHRKVARTDYVWKEWFKEMTLKTVIKKACKYHFDDIFQGVEEMDNDNYNLENPLDIDIDLKAKIDSITTVKKLQEFYAKNSGKGKEVDKYISMKMEELQQK